MAEDTLARIKTHLFLTEHDVPVKANRIVRGYFTADGETADLWAKAEAGTMDASEQKRFQSLMGHEYVESYLMEAGMPYRSAHPAAWMGDVQIPNALHFGAHDAAPRSADGLFSHWPSLGLRPPGIAIAPDLSNIDDVLNAVRKGLQR